MAPSTFIQLNSVDRQVNLSLVKNKIPCILVTSDWLGMLMIATTANLLIPMEPHIYPLTSMGNTVEGPYWILQYALFCL